MLASGGMLDEDRESDSGRCQKRSTQSGDRMGTYRDNAERLHWYQYETEEE